MQTCAVDMCATELGDGCSPGVEELRGRPDDSYAAHGTSDRQRTLIPQRTLLASADFGGNDFSGVGLQRAFSRSVQRRDTRRYL